MPEIIEIPVELTHFQLPEAVQERLQFLLDRQDIGKELTQAERREAEGLVELVEFLSLRERSICTSTPVLSYTFRHASPLQSNFDFPYTP